MISPTGFHHAALHARDVEAVARFYREVLGLSELARHLRPDGSLRSIWLSLSASRASSAGFLAVEDARDLGGADVAETASSGFTMLALGIAPDVRRATEAELQRRGVAVVKQTPFTLYVQDPEGNLVGLSHHPHPAQG